MRDEIRPADLPSQFAKIPSRISFALSSDQADLVTQWSQTFVVPNSFLNEKKTRDQRDQARERVGTVYRTIEQGQVIVREGEVATPLDIEALGAIGILRPNPSYADYVGPALFAVLISRTLVDLLGAFATHPRRLFARHVTHRLFDLVFFNRHSTCE